ncbi:IPT/TIG domain-containing protein [Kitasatospora sp. NPDC091335]|uniref:IPT/TIG domain-containing protein n=1 Tax=Kitasatospora sp. NPDC091335 TaxID=3364085 RepID=UPI003806215E
MTSTRSTHKPKIDDIDPEAAKKGATITISGDHLAFVTKVHFDDGSGHKQDAVPTVVDDETLTVTVPDGLTPGTYDVTVEGSGGTSGSYKFVVLK